MQSGVALLFRGLHATANKARCFAALACVRQGPGRHCCRRGHHSLVWTGSRLCVLRIGWLAFVVMAVVDALKPCMHGRMPPPPAAKNSHWLP